MRRLDEKTYVSFRVGGKIIIIIYLYCVLDYVYFFVSMVIVSTEMQNDKRTLFVNINLHIYQIYFQSLLVFILMLQIYI